MSGHTSFLILFICVSILVAIFVYFIKKSDLPYTKEGFAVYVCPDNTTSFVNDDGETLCCNGDVVDGYCTGNLKCTLSPKTKSGLPTCKQLAASDASSAAASKCPRKMSNYFARLDKSLRGCSESQPTPDGTAPSDPNKPQCILYPTQFLDEIKLDSCYNVIKNESRAAECAAAETTAALPACAAAAAAAISRGSATPACPVPDYKKKLMLGNNPSGVKTIDLPGGAPTSGLCVALLSNQYSDTFKFTIDKNKLTATRTDAPGQGWGANHEIIVFTCGS